MLFKYHKRIVNEIWKQTLIRNTIERFFISSKCQRFHIFVSIPSKSNVLFQWFIFYKTQSCWDLAHCFIINDRILISLFLNRIFHCMQRFWRIFWLHGIVCVGSMIQWIHVFQHLYAVVPHGSLEWWSHYHIQFTPPSWILG